MRRTAFLSLLVFCGCFDAPTPEVVLDARGDATPDVQPDMTVEDLSVDQEKTYKTIASIHAAFRATCALFEDKTVECWGSDTFGLKDVPTLGPVKYVETRYGTACAVEESGEVVCWGHETVEVPLATPPDGLRDPIKISMGPSHACALTRDSTIVCWGSNRFGELDAPPDSNWTDVSVGNQFTCGIKDELVRCWGWDGFGTAPVLGVTLPDGAAKIAAGNDFACAITTIGAVYCWGRSTNQRIPGAADDIALPTRIELPRPATNIGIALDTACVFLDNERPYCWGSNTFGQVGQNTSSPAPPDWLNFEGGLSLNAGWSGFCAMTVAGPACWGSNDYGETAPAFGFSLLPPTPIGEGRVITRGVHTCQESTAVGTYTCFGGNGHGQIPGAIEKLVLGDGLELSTQTLALGATTTCVSAPSETTCTGTDFGFPMQDRIFQKISVGWEHACGITSDGVETWCWGNNIDGAVGPGNEPVSEWNVGTFDDIQTSEFSTCGLIGEELHCWGGNTYGEMMTDTGMPVRGPNGPTAFGVQSFCLGARHGCFVDQTRNVYCWGDNNRGQRGSDSTTPTATLVSLPDDVGFVACGAKHSCALVGEQIYCWGSNHHGAVSPERPLDPEPAVATSELSTSIFDPVLVDVPQGRLVLGSRHSCVETPTDTICWGDTSFNQFGLGNIASVTPEPIKMNELRQLVPLQ